MGPRHVFTCVRIRGATRPLTTRVPRRVLSVTGSGFDLNPAGFFGPGPQVPGTRIPVSNVSLWSAGLTIPPETLQKRKRSSATLAQYLYPYLGAKLYSHVLATFSFVRCTSPVCVLVALLVYFSPCSVAAKLRHPTCSVLALYGCKGLCSHDHGHP